MIEFVNEAQALDYVTHLPAQAKSLFRFGFSLLSEMSEQQQRIVVEGARQAIATSLPDSNEVAARLGKDANVAEPAIAAAAITTTIFARTSVELAPEQFRQIFIKAGVIDEALSDALKNFFEIACAERQALRSEVERTDDARAVLPNLASFTLGIDVRVSFEGNEVRSMVPVVVANIDTDAEGQVLWCQMTKEQLTRLRADFDAALQKLEATQKKLGLGEG
jgi:hypothetical protein